MRTVPASILALRGVSSTRAPLFLVEMQFVTSGTKYYSSGESVVFGGNTYEANRVMSIPTFEAGLVDRKLREFSKLEIRLDNLSDSGTSAFPITVIEGVQNLEDSLVYVHLYSPDAADGIARIWWGFAQGRKYDGTEKSVTISASFFWDALDSPLPTRLLSQSGFGPNDASAQNSEANAEELAVPIVYGVSNFKVRPAVYNKVSDGAYFYVNFILSGCNGQPFQLTDVTAAETKLFSTNPATSLEFLTGTSGQAPPVNLSRFPDGNSHPNVAYGFAAFKITNEIKDKLDDIASDDIKMQIANGRPLLDTALPSENPVLILKDILRDPNFGMGFPSAVFDAAAITSAANYAGTRYQMRFELHERKSAADIVQYVLGNFHGYITFENGLIQIKCKRNTESSVATFSTVDSGGSGRKVNDDFTDVHIKDSSEIINQATVKYRLKKRNRRIVTLYDPAAQVRAGGTYKKVVEDEFDFLDAGGVFTEDQAKILAAIVVREEQNGDLFLSFSSPIWDSIDIAIGDIIQVQSPDIFGTNTFYRVTKQTIDTEGDFLVHFECQVYKSAIYNDDAIALGVDLLRGGDATDLQGRPPDVIPVALTIQPLGSTDIEGVLLRLRATWTYPTVDLATEHTEGIFREYPISEVELWWRYTDESINELKLGRTVRYPNPRGHFQIDFYRSRSVQVFFVAMGANRARAPFGYIPDATKTSALSANLSATSPTAVVYNATPFTNGDFVIIEKEIDLMTSKSGLNLTLFDGVTRQAQIDTTAIAHPIGTEVSVAIPSYPSIVKSLNLPRFTYPAVTTVNFYQRPDGVKVRITDIAADNIEDYYIYWSKLDDPGFGSATPAWYFSDPLAPPAGISYINGKSLHMTIPQEFIGTPGQIVFIRVAARNGTHDWSSQLSPVASARVGDDGVPVVATQPTLVPKSKGLRVKVVMPTTNMNTFPTNGKVEVVLKSTTSGGILLGYLTDSTGSAYTSSATEFKFDLGLARTHTFPIDKATLQTLWPTIGFLEVYAYVTNAVGTSGPSPSRSINVTTWEVLEVTNDLAVPSGLATPAIDWTAAGRLRVRGMSATNNIHTQKKHYLVISDGTSTGATKYLDIPNRTTITGVSNEVSARFEFGLKSHINLSDIKKKIFKNVFGDAGTFIAYWYCENDINVSLKSTDSNSLSVAAINETLSDGRDAVNVIDIGVTLTGYQNNLLNGDFLYDTGVAARVNGWLRGTIGGSSAIISNNTANNIFWDQTSHSIHWISSADEMWQILGKRQQRNDFYSCTIIAKVIGGGVFTSGDFNFAIVNDDDTIAITVGAGFPLNLLTSSYQLFGVTLQTDNVSDFGTNKNFRLSVVSPSPAVSTTREIVIDKVMLVRGKVGSAFVARASAYEGSATALSISEDIPTSPTGTSNFDVGNPVGTQGGWVGVGLGGRIEIQTN